MSTTHLPVFDTTLQESIRWLKAVMIHLHTDDRHLAYLALRGTLHALRDRIGPENAVHLAAQLPMLLRGCTTRAGACPRARLRSGAGPNSSTTCAASSRRIRRSTRTWQHARSSRSYARSWDPGEVQKVANRLPSELRELWY